MTSVAPDLLLSNTHLSSDTTFDCMQRQVQGYNLRLRLELSLQEDPCCTFRSCNESYHVVMLSSGSRFNTHQIKPSTMQLSRCNCNCNERWSCEQACRRFK